MKTSNFIYLESQFPILFNIGQSAELNLHSDPVTALFKLRLFGERLTELLFEEHYLEFPHDNSFHNRLRILQDERLLPERVKDLLYTIKNKGNVAVHQNKGSKDEAKTVLFSAFKVAKWFYATYGTDTVDISDVKYSLPKEQNFQELLLALESSYEKLEKKFNQLLEEREIKTQTIQERNVIRAKSESIASKIEMTEAETREIIDQHLSSAGWEVNTNELNFKTRKTLPEKGRNMAIAEWPTQGKWADYALFVGTKLYGIVEAKKYANDISTDLTQAKVYSEKAQAVNDAELLGQWRNYQVPFLFATNGRPFLEQIKTKSGIWFLDVRKENNRSRPLRGWFSPDGLKEEFERDVEDSNLKLKNSDLAYLQNRNGLSLRDYQITAIKSVEEKIVKEPNDRRALLTMATGTGKTRTVMGLCYRLIKANRFKRILFLVDRTLLAKQALDNFNDTKIEDLNTFATTYKVDSMKTIIPDMESRLHFATVQGMVQRLFYSEDAEGKLPIDTYDCIIVDEAHRGYLQDKEMDEEEINFKDQRDYVSKYRLVLDYFDAYAIGLTATPALHTKEIFGPPVFVYSYPEAVLDGFLIDHEPPYIIKTKLSEEGIVWKKGEKPKVYDREENQVIELDELEDELAIDVSGFNKLVITESFNRTVVQQLVKELDPDSDEKTLIFAAKDEHADRLVYLLKEEFENIGVEVSDDSIVKITGKSYNPGELVRRFKNEKYPNIAVTVDLLSTGIDVPSICNLVFLRRIRSRILYEQMLGRATRRCDEIGKEVFRIYDAVGVYETLEDFTQMKPIANPKVTFQQLAEEMPRINSNDRAQKQLDQIIAKLQRKKNKITGSKEEKFAYQSQGKDPEAFINMLKETTVANAPEMVMQYTGLWKFLDALKPAPQAQFVSEHEDEFIATERGYGKGQKPDDYLQSFENFIKQNVNTVTALGIICTRPKDLDRQSLKELKLWLDQEGYNTRSLNAAWKDTRNVDIAADIISYIRTLAVGNELIDHQTRISNAVEKVRSMNNWNKIQLKWIDRIEKQLLQENIIKKEDLDNDPFDEAGGFERLDKIFEHQLEEVIDVLNDNLYSA